MSKMQCMLETQFELGSLCHISLAQANGQLRFNLDAGSHGKKRNAGHETNFGRWAMQMLLKIQELAAIRQLPQSLGSLSNLRLFSAAQAVTPEPRGQPGQGPPRFYKSVGVRPASDQAGPLSG